MPSSMTKAEAILNIRFKLVRQFAPEFENDSDEKIGTCLWIHIPEVEGGGSRSGMTEQIKAGKRRTS